MFKKFRIPLATTIPATESPGTTAAKLWLDRDFIFLYFLQLIWSRVQPNTPIPIKEMRKLFSKSDETSTWTTANHFLVAAKPYQLTKFIFRLIETIKQSLNIETQTCTSLLRERKSYLLAEALKLRRPRKHLLESWIFRCEQVKKSKTVINSWHNWAAKVSKNHAWTNKISGIGAGVGVGVGIGWPQKWRLRECPRENYAVRNGRCLCGRLRRAHLSQSSATLTGKAGWRG